MSKSKPVPDSKVESPDLPFYPVVIGGATFKLCFDMDELCKSEELFKRQGHAVNVLYSLDVAALDLRGARVLFACAARTFHPELGFEGALKLFRVGSIHAIGSVLLNAFSDDIDQLLAAAVVAANPLAEA